MIMKTQPSHGLTPVRRDLVDPRSSSAARTPARKILLNDRRSTH